MESTGAKKYTVVDDRKQRSSVLLDKFAERKLSWIKAMEKDNNLLVLRQTEVSNFHHPRPLTTIAARVSALCEPHSDGAVITLVHPIAQERSQRDRW